MALYNGNDPGSHMVMRDCPQDAVDKFLGNIETALKEVNEDE